MKNICKFTSSLLIDTLKTRNFVYESDISVMEKPVKPEFNRAILISQGKAELKIDNNYYRVSYGNLIFVFSGEEISVVNAQNTEFIYIEFEGNRADILFRRFGITAFSRLFTKFDSLIPLWIDSLTRSNEKSIDLASESVLLYTFSRLNCDFSKQNNIVTGIVEIVEEQFSDPKMSISSISEKMSYNSKYLSHIFKELMGIGFSEYLRNFRIKYAVSLFDNGLDSVKNVAFLSGFNDPIYFSTAFKKVIGISPREYIRKNKQA